MLHGEYKQTAFLAQQQISGLTHTLTVFCFVLTGKQIFSQVAGFLQIASHVLGGILWISHFSIHTHKSSRACGIPIAWCYHHHQLKAQSCYIEHRLSNLKRVTSAGKKWTITSFLVIIFPNWRQDYVIMGLHINWSCVLLLDNAWQAFHLSSFISGDSLWNDSHLYTSNKCIQQKLFLWPYLMIIHDSFLKTSCLSSTTDVGRGTNLKSNKQEDEFCVL